MRSSTSMFSSVIVTIMSLSLLQTAFGQAARNLSFADWQSYNSAWHMDYVDKLVDERLDPIVNPNGISGHLHAIIGGSRFGASYNGAEYKKAQCTTCPISADKSNYWMPKLFWINNGGTSFTPIAGNQRFYYFLQQSSPNEPVSPFPDGLRMLTGNPDSKAADSLRFLFTCQVNPPPYQGSIRSDNFNFDRDCPNGMKVETHFPQCWDGVNLYKKDGSHMSYPVGGSYRVGNCPWTHPVRIPQVMTEFTYGTSSWAAGTPLKGNLAWANGDTTGYGVHADFVAGWDGDVLARALNDTRCTTGDEMAIEKCPVFAPYYDFAGSRASVCKPERGVALEGPQIVDNVPIPQLPGCSPLWNGQGTKPACPSGDFTPDISGQMGDDGPYIANPTQNKVLPTTPGWKDIGCIREAPGLMLNDITEFYDDSISQTSCANTCLKNGFSYAAVGLTQGKWWKCLCGTGVVDQAQLWPNMCNSPCPGNSSQVCGGDFSGYTLLYAPKGTTNTASNSSYLGCYQNPSPASTGLEGKATYSFTTSTTMTQEMCFQACADRGLGWAAIRYGSSCFCGADNAFDLGAGKYVSDATCNVNCTGNKAEVCGYYQGSSVFNVTDLGYKKKDAGMPAGYQGCFNLPSGKGVKDYTYWDNSLIPERCTLGCLELGYQYAEVDTGKICNCGNTLTLGNSQPPSFCQAKCLGSANQTCGGSYNGDLYTTNSSQPRLTALIDSKHAGWTGCYDNSKAGGFKDWSRVNTAQQTVDRCQISCSELGYKWAGVQNGDTCKCSNVAPETQIKRTPTSLSCNAPCKGNSSETCGGTGGMIEAYDLSKYTKEVTNNNGPGYVGCYQQNSGPGLKAGLYYDDKMTVEMCAGMCKETGNLMAGLSNNQCSCGNTWEGGVVLASLSCTQACPGNANQTCGASYIASVFNSTIGTNVTMPVAGYEGCYTDSANRTMTGYMYSSKDGMSPTSCKTTCAGRGYAFSGTQNGGECYCSNELAGVGKQVPSVQCSVACTGNSAQKCGASWRLSVYKTGSTGNSTAPVAVPGKSTGCYQDFSVLDGANYYSDYMSANLCLPWCKAKGFAFGGMSGRQCRCGNTSPSIVVARSTCALPCTGNSTQTCGSTSGYADVWSAATVFAANSYTTPDNKGYMGCWTDGSARLLTGSVFTSNTLTPATCAANCAANKYTFAGVQNGNECRCGNALDPKTTYYRAGENECPKACTGDASAKCGGSYRYNVYATKEFLAGAGNGNTTTPGVKAEGLLGCYGRGTYASTSAVQTTSSNGMTTGYCRKFCAIKGFASAGLMGGNTCYCGSQNTLAGSAGDAACTAPCTGNSTATCGGDITLSVFDTKGAGAITLPGYPTDYVGCYVDGTPRLLPAFSVKTATASPAQCKAVCDAKGFPIYGLQNGNECFCGSLSSTDIVTDNQCSTACGGDASQKCGGWYRMSVFGKLTSNTTTTTSAAPSASASSSVSKPASSVSSSSSKPASSSSASKPASSSSSVVATTSRAASSSASVSRSASASATTVSSSTASESASNDSTDTSIPSTSMSSSSSSSSDSVPVTSASSSISVSASSSSASVSATSSPASAELPVVTSSSMSSSSMSVPESSSASASSSSAAASSSDSSSAAPTSASSSSAVPSSSSASSSSAAPTSAASSSQSSASSAAPTTSLPASSSSSSASATTSSSSAPAPVPTDASLVGCFGTTTAFANANMTCDATSPRMCKIWCNAMNFKYAAVHKGDYCGCSNDIGGLNQVDISQCNVPCVADGSKTCGGQSSFEVFEAAPFGKARRDLSHTARGRAKWVRKSE